ncbi:MAG: hypothetical protein N3E37_04650 [Candidatus Micrarchaeota archaeon]|nr:hypothetical protein [Candidatus Micrarchaeota archaeon]
MLLPCEEIYKTFIPAVKCLIAKELKENYNLTQIQIGQLLGMTQAAVSKALNEKQSEKVKEMMKKEKVIRFAKELSEKIYKEKLTKKEISRLICERCNSTNFSNNEQCIVRTIKEIPNIHSI